MCFSLSASVAAGTALSAAGVVTVKLTRRRAEKPLALMPLLFGVQQLTEGLVWWSLNHNAATLNAWSTFVYTLFSHVLWPVYVPFAFWCMEGTHWRKMVLAGCLILGAAVGLDGLYIVIATTSASHVAGNSIQYTMPSFYIIALYLLATCGGAVFSSRTIIRLLGAGALGLALVTLWLYMAVFISVWCFFSAILTFMIVLHFVHDKTRSLLRPAAV